MLDVTPPHTFTAPSLLAQHPLATIAQAPTSTPKATPACVSVPERAIAEFTPPPSPLSVSCLATPAVEPEFAVQIQPISTTPPLPTETSADTVAFPPTGAPPLPPPAAAPAPSVPATPPPEANPATRIEARKQELEQKLAEIVANDPRRQTAQPNQIIAQAIAQANQGEFAAARQVLQHPALPHRIRLNVLNRVNSLEAAQTTPVNRLTAATKAKPEVQPVPRSPQTPTPAKPRTVPPATRAAARRPMNVVALHPEFMQNYYQQNLPPLPATNLPDVQQGLLFPLPSPVPITSPYGWRQHPVLGGRRFHKGTDLGAPYGMPVLAAHSGKVRSARWMGGYGLAVELEHDNGTLDTLYAHLSQVTVQPGQRVEQGTVIGRVGSSGLSTGPHLHFELRHRTARGWEHLDPGPQLQVALASLERSRRTGERAL